MENFDYKNPDYKTIFADRARALAFIRNNPEDLPAIKAYYRENIAQFICDWGMTLDAKLAGRDKPTLIPFLLFPRQIEFVDKVIEKWRKEEPLLTEKTRQMGFSWLSMAVACSLCIFYPGMSIGFGSRKEEYVDKVGDPKSLFEKARTFISNLPVEFRAGWTQKSHAPHMRLLFPDTGSTITGEAGDNIGRGATTSIYFVDEAAFIERPHLIEASLSQTTNCRIDISTPNGLANPFAEKRHSGKIEVFTFHWRDDPRKDQAWYDKQVRELDPVTVAQEIDIDYAASVEGVVIPASWVRAAVDADRVLGISVKTHTRTGALDVADEGVDMNAFCGRQGILLDFIDEWTGAGSTLYKTAKKAIDICDTFNYESFKYDADGLGASIRGDAEEINKKRKAIGEREVNIITFRGSAAVLDPEKEDVKGRKNEDYFKNYKAQAYWNLRLRFERTYNWVVDGKPCNPDQIISIRSGIKYFHQLCSELSQPVYTKNETTGQIIIDKKPEGMKSPNFADACMMVFARSNDKKMKINRSSIDRI